MNTYIETIRQRAPRGRSGSKESGGNNGGGYVVTYYPENDSPDLQECSTEAVNDIINNLT